MRFVYSNAEFSAVMRGVYVWGIGKYEIVGIGKTCKKVTPVYAGARVRNVI